MLVCLNVCPKDVALAEKNVEWCLRLDSRTPLELLLLAERGTDIRRLHSAANEYFAKVHTHVYDAFTGPNLWPQRANAVWQECARFVAANLRQPWYWLEADVTPLKAGWAKQIAEEYERGGQPFMGHIVPRMGHMNGAAVYPPDVARHSVDAMICRSSPFDVMLWRDIKTKTHPANHLLAHFPRHTGVQLAFRDKVVANRLRDSGAVVFHGCNDGSLIDLLSGHKPNGHFKRPVQRVFTLGDIGADIDESEAMWQSDAAVLQEKGYGVLPYAECVKPVPSITRQTRWPCGIFPLPLDNGQCHFNAGVLRAPDGLQLVTRRWTRNVRGDWTSALVAWKLDADLYPQSPHEIKLPGFTGVEQYEDPRCVVADGRFWVSYCVWRHGRVYRAHQSLSAFDTKWQWQQTINAPYSGNGYHVGGGSAHEKNWVWFRQGGRWHFVYSFQPHTVVEVVDAVNMREYKTSLPSVPWDYGEIHGGTPPVRVGDEYVTFFHSSTAWRGRRKRYYAGAYAFSAQPPFKPTRLTREPLLRGSEADARLHESPLVVFPCGALLEDGGWLVTLGVNDQTAAWLRVPNDELNALLVSL